MKKRKINLVLLAYLIVQLLTVGCATDPNRRAPDYAAAAASFQRASDSLRYFEAAPQPKSTHCQTDGFGGMICR